jgi:hypothetical protein
MNEVERVVGPDQEGVGAVDVVPTDVGQSRSAFEASHNSRYHPEATGPILFRAIEQNLHPDADSEHRNLQALQGLGEAGGDDPAHDRRGGSDSGKDHSGCGGDYRRV